MQERRRSSTSGLISHSCKVERRDGAEVVEEGLTENVGHREPCLPPEKLPTVGAGRADHYGKSGRRDTVSAQVIRLERNAAHPLVAVIARLAQAWRNRSGKSRRNGRCGKPDTWMTGKGRRKQ